MINKPLSELSRKDIYCRLKFMHLFNTRRRILNIAALSEVVISFDALSLCRKSKAYLFNGNIKLIWGKLKLLVLAENLFNKTLKDFANSDLEIKPISAYKFIKNK